MERLASEKRALCCVAAAVLCVAATAGCREAGEAEPDGDADTDGLTDTTGSGDADTDADGPPETSFIVDRPFAAAIADRCRGAVLFAGRVVEPPSIAD